MVRGRLAGGKPVAVSCTEPRFLGENGVLAYNSSMSLTLKEVEHIAKLARLQLTDEQKEKYRGQLSSILDHIAKLQELDTKDVPPTTGGSLTEMLLRADEALPSLSTEALFANAPEKEDNQFKVPPVFE